MMPVVAPETWYRAYWTLWALAAIVAARVWLVNPILRAQERTTAAIDRQTAALMHLTIAPRLQSDRSAD